MPTSLCFGTSSRRLDPLPVLQPEAYTTLGVTHDHPLLGVSFDPDARRFELHLEGAYLIHCPEGPEREYRDVRITVEAWQAASLEAQIPPPTEEGGTSDVLWMVPFDPRKEPIREIMEFDLAQNVLLGGLLETESFRWFQISFCGAQVTVTYSQIALLNEG
ncbi:hypothetical protein [Deinococcus gobiensis]|uniref:hypothetical protein n=1 Tax=Deinococcus gobiensis TaxID=502394 RepID=UPI0011AE41B1|nr:hypothetical protein [Deinococcus gobiensis]